MHITWGQATDTGLVREQNEDAVFSLYVRSDGAAARPDFGIFIVADGWDSSHTNIKASQTAIWIISQALLDSILKPLLETETYPPVTDAIISAFHLANSRLSQEEEVNSTTITAVIIVGDTAYICHAGDTAVALCSHDEVRQLTDVHRIASKLVQLGHITWEQFYDYPNTGNILYRSLGMGEKLEVDATSLKLTPNSWLVLFSDGLVPQFDYEAILPEIKKCVEDTPDPQQACDQLIALANERGGEDNTSVIVIKVSE